MPLVTASQMTALQNVALQGMDTPVDIYPRIEIETASDTAEGWPTKSLSTRGWIRSMPGSVFNVDVGVLEASVPFRLFLPVGTPIGPGDHVKIEGNEYAVVDTTVENTIKIVLRCTLRKLGS